MPGLVATLDPITESSSNFPLGLVTQGTAPAAGVVNLDPNPAFEVGLTGHGTAAGFRLNTGAALTHETGAPHSGRGCAKLVTTAVLSTPRERKIRRRVRHRVHGTGHPLRRRVAASPRSSSPQTGRECAMDAAELRAVQVTRSTCASTRVEMTLTFMALPYWRGIPILLADHAETSI